MKYFWYTCYFNIRLKIVRNVLINILHNKIKKLRDNKRFMKTIHKKYIQYEKKGEVEGMNDT